MKNKGKTTQNKATPSESNSKGKQKSPNKNKPNPRQQSGYSSKSPNQSEPKKPVSIAEPKEPTKEEMEKIIAIQKEEQELKRKEDEEAAKQTQLKKKKEDIGERMAFEYDQRERLLDLKRKELEKKFNTIAQIQETNKKMQADLDYLQAEVQVKLNKFEFKAKNDQLEEKKLKTEWPLEQLKKVKDKEINNALAIINNYKAASEKYEKILREDKDLEQINRLNDENKALTKKIDDLNKELAYLTKLASQHEECLDRIDKVELRKKELKKRISEIKNEFKMKILEERNAKVVNMVSQSERFKKTKEEKEAVLKEKIDEYWKENSSNVNDDYMTQSMGNKRNSSFSNGNTKVKDWSRKVANMNMKVEGENLPSLPLFQPEEKKILMDILPKKEVEKYEKRFGCVESVKTVLERRLYIDTHQMAKENKDIEHMYEYSSLQLKENEQKNKLLSLQINEQKKELKDLKVQIIEAMRQLEKTKEREKEKEMENKKLVKHLQDLQNKYEKSETKDSNEEDIEVKSEEEADAEY